MTEPTDSRVDRVRRICESDPGDLAAAVHRASKAERLDAIELLTLSRRLGQDTLLLVDTRWAYLRAAYPELDAREES